MVDEQLVNFFKENIKKYNPFYNSNNFEFENNIKSVPLYALFCINKRKVDIKEEEIYVSK